MKNDFNEAFLLLRQKIGKNATKKVSEALGVKSRQALWLHRNGKVEMTVSQYNAVKQVFMENGIMY